jgi:hypothetical protein
MRNPKSIFGLISASLLLIFSLFLIYSWHFNSEYKAFAVQNETEGTSLLGPGLDQTENSGNIGNQQNNSAAVTPQATTTAMQAEERTPIGLIAEGTINSLVTTPTTRWIATGNWSMNVINGTIKFFATNMTWYNSNGTAAHSHEFLNFAGDKGKVITLQQPGNNVNIKGIMDVGTNNRIVWKNVLSTIEINGKKTITISVDDNATNHHFASQPILGVVKTFVLCSDIPGPDMEVLPPCTPSTPENHNVSSLSMNNTNAGFESTPTLQSPSVRANISEEQSKTVSPNINNENNGNLPFQIYENSTYGIKISYPPDWIFQRGRTVNPSLDIAAKISLSSDSITDFTIGIRKLGAEAVTIKEYVNNTLNTYKKQARDFQPTLVNTNGKLAGNPAYEIDGTYVDDQTIKHQIFEVGTILNNKAYILQFDSDESKIEAYMPDLKVMIPSFQIIGKNQEESSQVVTSKLGQTGCEKVQISDVKASGFETDPKDYNPPDHAIDGDLATWWANQGLPSWLQVDLEIPTTLCGIEIAWNKGDERTYDFVISTSKDGASFTDAYTGHSSGKTLSYEKYDIINSPSSVNHIKISFTGSSSKSGWVSIKEVNVLGEGGGIGANGNDSSSPNTNISSSDNSTES